MWESPEKFHKGTSWAVARKISESIHAKKNTKFVKESLEEFRDEYSEESMENFLGARERRMTNLAKAI